jgi:hypothetical protein
MATPDQLAVWRRTYEELHESMVKSREQFMAWSEEVALVEAQNQTMEFRGCVLEIKQDLQRYGEVLNKLPKIQDLSDEEVEKNDGKAGQLLDVVQEVTALQINLPRKVEKLHFMLKSTVAVKRPTICHSRALR